MTADLGIKLQHLAFVLAAGACNDEADEATAQNANPHAHGSRTDVAAPMDVAAIVASVGATSQPASQTRPPGNPIKMRQTPHKNDVATACSGAVTKPANPDNRTTTRT